MSILDKMDNIGDALSRKSSGLSVQQIALTRITPDPDQPRKTFDQTALEELAQSITARGVLQPITLRTNDGGKSYIIRYGERRFRAAGLAGLAHIPAIVTEKDGDENDLLDQVIENDQRADLTAFEMADVIAKSLSAGIKAADIARKLGRPKSVITQYAALRDMPPILRDLADTTAIRTIYELYQGWKIDPAKVEAFVAASDGTGIRRAAAIQLVKTIGQAPGQSLQPETDSQEPPLNLGDQRLPGQTLEGGEKRAITPPTVPPVSTAAPAKRAATPPSKGPVSPNSRGAEIAVVIDGRRARLVLPATVDVVFYDDGSSASVDSASVIAADEE